jgi:hypothetical protein
MKKNMKLKQVKGQTGMDEVMVNESPSEITGNQPGIKKIISRSISEKRVSHKPSKIQKSAS